MRKIVKWLLKKVKGHLSTPLPCYFFLLIITIILLIFGLCIPSDVFKNVGYSLLASIIAAVFIDIGNTKAAHREELREFHILTAGYINAFNELREAVVNAYEMRYDYDKKKRTFEQWIEAALNPNYTDEELSEKDFFDIAWEIEWVITRIRKNSIILSNRFIEYLQLTIVTDDYRRHVNRVEAICGVIEREFDEGKYKYAEKNIIEKLLPCFLANHPQFKEMFETPYSLNDDEII